MLLLRKKFHDLLLGKPSMMKHDDSEAAMAAAKRPVVISDGTSRPSDMQLLICLAVSVSFLRSARSRSPALRCS